VDQISPISQIIHPNDILLHPRSSDECRAVRQDLTCVKQSSILFSIQSVVVDKWQTIQKSRALPRDIEPQRQKHAERRRYRRDFYLVRGNGELAMEVHFFTVESSGHPETCQVLEEGREGGKAVCRPVCNTRSSRFDDRGLTRFHVPATRTPRVRVSYPTVLKHVSGVGDRLHSKRRGVELETSFLSWAVS